jgi:hypothetical protein
MIPTARSGLQVKSFKSVDTIRGHTNVRACLFRDSPPDPRTQALGKACVQLLELLKSSLDEEGLP